MAMLVETFFFVPLIVLVVAFYNWMRMSAYIKSDTPLSSRGLYPAFPKNAEFSDPKGQHYRRKFILWLVLFFVSLLIFGLLISTLPQGTAPP